MDFECIETWLALPEFRVTGQVMRPHNLELHLERRDTDLVCPHCQGSCARIKEGRQRCLRDLPILERPVTLRLHLRRLQCSACHHRPWEQSETFGEHVKWTERLYQQVRQEYRVLPASQLDLSDVIRSVVIDSLPVTVCVCVHQNLPSRSL